MQVAYEPNWTSGAWQTPQLNTTNYSDWLRDSSDAGTDSDECISATPPIRLFHQDNTTLLSLPPTTRPIVLDVISQETAWDDSKEDRLWVESATEKPKSVGDEKKKVQRSQSCRTKGSKLSQLVHRNGGHSLEPIPDPLYENLTTKDSWVDTSKKPPYANVGFATIRPSLKQSKSMRSLKDVSWNPDADAIPNKPNLKHSKSLRSLKNKDRHHSRTSSEESTKFSSNTLRRILKFPDILRSSNNVKNEWDDLKPISNLKTATSLNGFENPAIYSNNHESAELRLSKLLVNSKPFSSASQTRGEVFEETSYLPEEDLYANIDKTDSASSAGESLKSSEGSSKENRSIFKSLTLRIKKKMTSRSSLKSVAIDEYERAGVYETLKKRDGPLSFSDRPGYVNVSPPTREDDFAIPRPKLIVPVHTYGIRKRRTGNTGAPSCTTQNNLETISNSNSTPQGSRDRSAELSPTLRRRTPSPVGNNYGTYPHSPPETRRSRSQSRWEDQQSSTQMSSSESKYRTNYTNHTTTTRTDDPLPYRSPSPVSFPQHRSPSPVRRIVTRTDSGRTLNRSDSGRNYQTSSNQPPLSDPTSPTVITYKYSSHSQQHSKYPGGYDDGSREGPRPFPTPTPVPQPGDQSPPKKIDDLMASFHDNQQHRSYTNSEHYYREIDHQQRQHDLQRSPSFERNLRPSSVKATQMYHHPSPTPQHMPIQTSTPAPVNEVVAPPILTTLTAKTTRNVAGPPVYYPPGVELFTKKEEALMEQQSAGGKGKMKGKAKMEYKYEASEKSKEKSGTRYAVVPACLPVCCAMPCSIM